MTKDIVLVGTGNVASHLAHALSRRLIAVCSRNIDHARALAKEVGVEQWGTLADVVNYGAGIIVISIADNAIGELVTAIGHATANPLVVHTSGSIPKESLASISERTGVLYPLQTFSKNSAVDMSQVPFFTEAAKVDDYAMLDALAASIGGSVHHADAMQRRKLHIAGVFSSNFIIEMLDIAGKVLAEEGYPLSTVKPLVEATVTKAFVLGTHDALTGPAKRGDKAVMEVQRAGLADGEQRIYDSISEYIITTHNVCLK